MIFLRILLICSILTVFYGCRGKQDDVPKVDNEQTKTVVTNAVKAVEKPKDKQDFKRQYPKPKLPDYLEKNSNMPAGMDKLHAVERDFVAEQLEKLNKKLSASSAELTLAEKKARISDPKLGLLYKELIDKQIEYSRAREANSEYAAAKQKNVEIFREYQKMVKRQENLIKKEKADVK